MKAKLFFLLQQLKEDLRGGREARVNTWVYDSRGNIRICDDLGRLIDICVGDEEAVLRAEAFFRNIEDSTYYYKQYLLKCPASQVKIVKCDPPITVHYRVYVSDYREEDVS